MSQASGDHQQRAHRTCAASWAAQSPRRMCAASCSRTTRIRAALQPSAPRGRTIAGRRHPQVSNREGWSLSISTVRRSRTSAAARRASRSAQAPSRTAPARRCTTSNRIRPTRSLVHTAPAPSSHSERNQTSAPRRRSAGRPPLAAVARVVTPSCGTNRVISTRGAGAAGDAAAGAHDSGGRPTSHPGSVSVRTGMASAPHTVHVSTQWRSAADWRRRAIDTIRPPASSTEARTTAIARNVARVTASLMSSRPFGLCRSTPRCDRVPRR